ncbi:hypothetical protein LJJ44_20265 [Pseudomonas sp. B24_DOA]|nr:hypothetical protein LJJ44_20265 [Pseudomonas sp. B24_DOA]
MIDVYNIKPNALRARCGFINDSPSSVATTHASSEGCNQWQTRRVLGPASAEVCLCAGQSREKRHGRRGQDRYLQMIEMLQQMFFKLAPIQQKSQMMDNIDSLLELKK